MLRLRQFARWTFRLNIHAHFAFPAIMLLIGVHISGSSTLAQDNRPVSRGENSFQKVYGGGKNPFGEATLEDGKVRPLPLDLVEEKATAPEKKEKPLVPASVKKGKQTVGTIDGVPIVRPDGVTAAPNDADTTTLLNGADIEIATLVKAFSKLTRRNYIVDNNVKGKVTVHLTTPVTVEEAIHIFESILLLKGFTTVPIGKNVWKVIATKDAQKSTIPFVTTSAENPSEVLVTQLVRLKHTQAQELQSVLNQFISKDGLLTAFAGTNSLIVIDSESNIKRILELVDQLDVPAVDQDITIVPIQHAEAKDVAEKLKQILGEDKDTKDPSARAALNPQSPIRPASYPGSPGAATQGSGTQTGATSDRRQLPLKIIADERTNSIIVVADPLLTTKVRALCEQLDSPNDQSGGKFFVYRLKHADAEELADILNSLVSGSGGSGSSSNKGKEKTSGSSLSRGSSRNSRNSDSSSSRGSSNLSRSTSALTSADGSSGGKVAFEGEISISADTGTNSLVINASRGDYEKVRQVIEDLDIRRQQVLVEATILQVSLDNQDSVGVEWSTSTGSDNFGLIGQNNFGGITNLISNPAALSDLTIAAASTGSIVLPGGIALPSQAVLITALSRNTNVNVLSSPTILATDNEEAEIVVGQNVPFITSTSTNATNLNNTFNSIERQDVGITLRITPQVSAGGFVVLKIFVEVSNVVAGTRNDPNGPTTSVNTTETTVEVKSHQMIVTGGLISDEVSDATRGVPFMQDIPVLGALFKQESNTRRRNNLLVFITPKVISDQFVAREETKQRSGSLANEITNLNSQPDRSDILQNENIDRVVEELDTRQEKPSTINKGPKGVLSSDSKPMDAEAREAKRKTEDRIRSLLSPNAANEGGRKDKEESRTTPGQSSEGDSDGEELEFSVRPSLPGATTAQIQSEDIALTDHASQGKTTRGSAALQTPPHIGNTSGGARTYVVLRQIGGREAPETLRFAGTQKTLGLSIMGSHDSAPGRFFVAGKRYLYRVGDEDLQFVCLGTFASAMEGGALEPSLSNPSAWQSLDAGESIRLGARSASSNGPSPYQWRAF